MLRDEHGLCGHVPVRGLWQGSGCAGSGLLTEICRFDSGGGFRNRARTIGFRDEIRPGIWLIVHQNRSRGGGRFYRKIWFREVCCRFRGYWFGRPLWTFRMNEVQAWMRVLDRFIFIDRINTGSMYRLLHAQISIPGLTIIRSRLGRSLVVRPIMPYTFTFTGSMFLGRQSNHQRIVSSVHLIFESLKMTLKTSMRRIFLFDICMLTTFRSCLLNIQRVMMTGSLRILTTILPNTSRSFRIL